MAEEFKKQREVRFIIWSILLTFISIGPVNAQLLWKVSKENHSDSFLFGTHHLIPNNLVKDIHGLEEAYQASTLIIGEIDINEMSDPSKVSYMSQAMIAPKDSTLTLILNEVELKHLNEVLQSFKDSQIPQEMLALMNPATISTLLVTQITMDVIKQDYPEDKSQIGIDFIFQQRASQDKKEIKGLETLKFQTDLLYKSTSIQESAKQLMESIQCIDSNRDYVEEQIRQMNQNYIKQNLNKLYVESKDQSKDTPCPSFSINEKDWKKMVDNRNQTWIPLLEQFLSSQTCFIAVGALHLPGSKGVINLLKEKGYTVEPIQSSK